MTTHVFIVDKNTFGIHLEYMFAGIDNSQYLFPQLQKHLTYRIIIEPFEVYADGVTEWEALDEIKNYNINFSSNSGISKNRFIEFDINTANQSITFTEVQY